MAAQQNTHSTPTVSNCLPLAAYLTAQLQEIICMGPGHAMMWADNRAHQPLHQRAGQKAEYDWLQVSVQGGAKCHLMVQFLLPETWSAACKQRMDTLFAQYGWTTEQANGRDCLIYYIAQSPDPRALLDEAESAAQQCAQAMAHLWQARNVEDITLLGARGPKLTQSRAVARPAGQQTTRALTRAA